MRLILGSGSPRRKFLLEEMGYTFDVLISHTDESFDPSMDVYDVAPFLAHHLMYLKNSNVSQGDIAILSDVFYETLKEHLGKHFNAESQLAWKKALRYFESFAGNVLFKVSNVVSLQQKILQKQSNKL